MTEFPLSELRESTAAAVRSPDFLQKILDATRECVLIVDSDLRVSNWNAPAERAFSRPGMEIGGRRLTEVIRDLDLHSSYRKAISTGEASDVRLELIGAERRKFDVHVAADRARRIAAGDRFLLRYDPDRKA